MLILNLTISGSIFFIIFLFISIFTKKMFSAKWHFYVCQIGILFFIFPIGSILKLFRKNEYVIMNENYYRISNEIYKVVNVDKIKYLVSIIWFIGVITYIILSIKRYFNINSKIELFDNEEKQLNNILEKCKLNKKVKSNILIKRNSEIQSPILSGIIKPIIRIPEFIVDEKELELAIAHELIHFKRGDLFKKLIGIISISLNWFNPLVYMINNTMDRWCEISCDELVVSNRSYDERKIYGNLLLKTIENIHYKNNFLCVSFCTEKKYIKRRLIFMLKDSKKSAIKGIISFAVLGGILFSATTISGITTNATEKNITELQNVNITENSEEINQDEENSEEKSMEDCVAGAKIISDSETGEIIEYEKWQGKIKDVPEEVGECLNDEFEKEHAEDEYKFVWMND
ncbi:MAG: M56 family metallopeptidase [Clostridium sp.]|nr:M56 family metallopeptidase [Clostridium sp.]